MISQAYICAAGHSGSTLLDLLIGSHSAAESLGEVSHLAKNIALNTKCSCGEPVRACSFWQRVIPELERRLNLEIWRRPYSLELGFPKPAVIRDRIHRSVRYKTARKFFLGLRYAELRYGLPVPSLLLAPVRRGITNNLTLYQTVRDLTGKQLVVDSSKDYLKGHGIYLTRPESTRIILLSRDGRGVLYSNKKRGFDRAKSLRGWRNYYSRCLALLRRHVPPEAIVPVKYEELVQDPAAQLRRICHAVGIPFEAQMLEFSTHTHHITNGNDMRFATSSAIRADLAWQTRLNADDLALFESIAGRLNRELGYP
ncbi:MAG: sulfotransferase [Chloroflexota bacterium]